MSLASAPSGLPPKIQKFLDAIEGLSPEDKEKKLDEVVMKYIATMTQTLDKIITGKDKAKARGFFVEMYLKGGANNLMFMLIFGCKPHLRDAISKMFGKMADVEEVADLETFRKIAGKVAK